MGTEVLYNICLLLDFGTRFQNELCTKVGDCLSYYLWPLSVTVWFTNAVCKYDRLYNHKY